MLLYKKLLLMTFGTTLVVTDYQGLHALASLYIFILLLVLEKL